MTWPNIAEPSHIARRKHKAQLKASFEAGYVQSVARDTRARLIFELEWRAMSTAELATLETFFADNQGGTFAWTDPSDSTVYTVRFRDDEINADYVDFSGGYWTVHVNIEEQ